MAAYDGNGRAVDWLRIGGDKHGITPRAVRWAARGGCHGIVSPDYQETD